jgi:hypothetical protein
LILELILGSTRRSMSMDTDMSPLLRAVLEEICANIPESEVATRQRVAAKIFEATRNDHWSLDDLRRAGWDALNSAPTMWR